MRSMFVPSSLGTSEVADNPRTLDIEAHGVEDRGFLSYQTGESGVTKDDGELALLGLDVALQASWAF